MRKVIMYIASDDGDGKIMSKEFDMMEDITIHTSMFNNVEITFEEKNVEE